jgi:non-ribosomal peptide synthetase component F
MQLNVIEYLEKIVKISPDKIAVTDGDKTIDFANLVIQSKNVATEIINRRIGLNRPIAIFLPKSLESVIANAAVTYSGNIYMNMDIKNPDVRIKNIFDKINPELIITNNEHGLKLKSLGIPEACILNTDERKSDCSFDNDIILKRLEQVIDTDPYCIINTSGSTGTPKGVVLNHRSFIDFTEWSLEALDITENEVIGSLSPLYFDIYSFELCLLMAKAATLVIIPDQLAIFPPKLVEYLETKKINFLFWVPTIMVNISNLNILHNYNLTLLKKILFAGEVFPTKHLNDWRKNIPEATFINLYGPIEITLDCTYYIVNKTFSNDLPIPIGFPCRNTDVLILNDENKLAAENEKGELCVRGSSLAMGYYNDPKKRPVHLFKIP